MLLQVLLNGQLTSNIQPQDVAVKLISALADSNLGVASQAEAALKAAGANPEGPHPMLISLSVVEPLVETSCRDSHGTRLQIAMSWPTLLMRRPMPGVMAFEVHKD